MVQAPIQHLEPEKPEHPSMRSGATLRPVRDASDPGAKIGLWLSVGLHTLGTAALLSLALLAPKKPSVVPVFELVNLNPPKLRPIRPKTPPPPEPPPPEPAKPLEAPKLTTKPEKAVVPNKPEPKVVREEPPDSTLKASPVEPSYEEPQTQIVSHVPADPRLSIWAGRVKKKAEQLWNPPAGLDILGKATSVVQFTVARDGVVSEVSVTTSAGNADLDAIALQTIQRMDHVPPLPENFPEDAVQVSYEFVYKGQ